MGVRHTNKEVISMKYFIFLSVLILSACSSTHETVLNSQSTDVMRLIEQVAENAPKGVIGTFQIPIKSFGNQGRMAYLNSELDYRDQRNITLAITPKAIKELKSKYGENYQTLFINKSLKVKGMAKRVKIFFISNGKITKKYYYQTHIRIDTGTQIQVLS